MFIDEKDCLYPSMSSLFERARRTGAHPAADAPEQISPDCCISDQLLYVQSNGRAQVCQDGEGRMACVGVAGKCDFPLPTLTQEPDQLIGALPGMYYQSDVAMMLGDLHFSVHLDDGSVHTAGDEGAASCYLDHFLPLTATVAGNLRLSAISLAPVLECGVASGIPGLPLPGPGGALHALHILNTSDRALTAEVRLNLSEHFVSQYQFSYRSMLERAHRPFQAEWDHNLLLMWRPDVCAAVQAQGFSPAGNPGMPTFSRHIALRPGEEITLCCYIAISTAFQDLHPALAVLYRHTPLEWINITAAFWRERLGVLRAPGAPALHQRALDFHMRSVLDNFNCYQFSPDGELVAHLQGAPSQISGRFWGIDAEPTALSVLYALPELIGPVMRYVAYRNRPAHAPFRDHSTPIFMAPMIIAARHYELTNELGYLRSDARLGEKLVEDARELLQLLHPSGLLPSRYSSDGHVFHRYDFGTNCKARYALRAGAPVLEALGEPELARRFLAAAERIPPAIREHMVADGPFGPQISGGSNLGEHEPFYLRDELLYYDGEDSSSCMAHLYGALGRDDPLWRNYHRFAHSLFCTNFDAENRALRWFAWGEALDGTALISALGGSVTRAEMAERLQALFDMATDDTGAMFWWPRAKNYVRGLTRCSQGQGAWVFQHTEQWLGLRMDAPNARLVVCPEGLYGGYEWLGARLGAGRFDIRFEERDDAAELYVKNLTGIALRVDLMARAQGEAFAAGAAATGRLEPYGELTLSARGAPTGLPEPPDIQAVECAEYAAHGPALGSYLYALPAASDVEPGICILPLAVLSGPRVLRDAALTVTAPGSFLLKPKRPMLLDEIADFDRSVQLELGDLPANARLARSVYIALPHKYRRCAAWLTRADFASLDTSDVPRALMLRAGESAKLGTLSVTLSWSDEGGAPHAVLLEIPIEARAEREFDQTRLQIFGGTNRSLANRLW